MLKFGVRSPTVCLQTKNATKNVVQYCKAFGLSEYGQIAWDFQTGPCLAELCDEQLPFFSGTPLTVVKKNCPPYKCENNSGTLSNKMTKIWSPL